MRPLRIRAALLALAASTVAQQNCFSENSNEIDRLASKCGDRNAIIECLKQLRCEDLGEATSCYIEAGCSPEEARDEAWYTVCRCQGLAANHELRRVIRRDTDSTADSESTAAEASTAASSDEASTAVVSTTSESSAVVTTTSTTSSTSTSTGSSSTADATTTADTTAASTATDSSASTASTGTTASSTATSTQTGAVKSGTACFTTTLTSTSACEVETSNGHVKTGSCTPTDVETSTCHSNMICTTNSSGDICMEVKGIQTEGIIIAIVFVSIIIVFFGGVCYASVRDGKRQKIAAEKAEAVALTRAMTKRKRMEATKAGV